jgi:hypothetical protein
MFKTIGFATAGGLTEGAGGAALGIVIAELWERAREAGVTTQFKTARGLVRVGDLLRTGKVDLAMAELQRLGEPLGLATTGVARMAGGPTRQPTTSTTPTMGPADEY